MGHYPRSATGLNHITYPVGPAVASITLTSSASTNTKGSYAEIAASIGFTSNSAHVHWTSTGSTVGRQYLCDIAVGAAAAEVVVIPDILMESMQGSAGAGAGAMHFPLKVPSGSRIAGRVACSTGSQSAVVGIQLSFAGDTPGITSFLNYGANSADSGGTSVDPGGSINTKGAYSQLDAAVDADVHWLGLMQSIGGNTAPANNTLALDIAIGAAASEVVLIPDLRVAPIGNSSGLLGMYPRFVYHFETFIVSGTRLAVRASAVITDATDRLIDLAVIAGTAPAERNLFLHPGYHGGAKV